MHSRVASQSFILYLYRLFGASNICITKKRPRRQKRQVANTPDFAVGSSRNPKLHVHTPRKVQLANASLPPCQADNRGILGEIRWVATPPETHLPFPAAAHWLVSSKHPLHLHASPSKRIRAGGKGRYRRSDKAAKIGGSLPRKLARKLPRGVRWLVVASIVGCSKYSQTAGHNLELAF